VTDGGTAFPVTPTDKSGQIAPTQPGMTLRDYFAAKAMQAIITKHKPVSDVSGIVPNENELQCARGAWAYADAMLAEREKTK